MLRLLFKSAEVFEPSPEAKLQMLDAARAALDLLELHHKLGIEPPKLPALNVPRRANEPLHQTAARQAQQARQRLGLELKPIPSVRDLLTQTIGIPILAAKLGRFGPDAFSVFAPGKRIAIVLNVDGKHENHLVRRFSLAHELGHALVDRPAVGGRGIACLIDSQREIDIETRANAFAIRLLASKKVERIGKDLLDAAVFRRTMEEWGIHYRALRLFTQKLLNMTDDEAESEIPSVDTTAPLTIRAAEELEAERSPAVQVSLPRRGELLRLVLREFIAGRMSSGRTRELLRIDATVDLTELAQVTDLA